MTREPTTIPLFPLHAVLYPGGRLPLRIFEQRYMDMAKVCLKDESAFGICLILHGKEAGQPAVPEEIGTLARIVEWDMPQLGVLNVTVQGEERFRIVDYQAERSGLLRATVDMIAPEPAHGMPDEYTILVPALRALFAEMGQEAPPLPHRFDDAAWVGFRFSELLPFYREDKQRLLEMADSLERLEMVRRFLQRNDWLPD